MTPNPLNGGIKTVGLDVEGHPWSLCPLVDPEPHAATTVSPTSPYQVTLKRMQTH